VALFDEAAETMAENKVVNLNAARVLMMYIDESGINLEKMDKVRKYLERVQRADPDNSTLRKMQKRFHALLKKD